MSEPPKNWLFPLVESRPSHAAFERAAKAINEFSPVVPAPGTSDVCISGFEYANGDMHIVARSNRGVYCNAEIAVRRPVAAVDILSGYPSMPVKPAETLRAKIPPSGVVALRIAIAH